ncbi:hypothetical protein TNCV_2174371 [Trichonephila clavipes]|nr:hypothetical protein TNCV_2174371 [Trichonephila clavipes]
MKRRITSSLNWFLESNNLTSPTHACYREWMSKNRQFTLLNQSTKNALDQRCSEATFDKVWRLQKLQNLVVCNDLPFWCCKPKEEQSKLNTVLNKSRERLEVGVNTNVALFNYTRAFGDGPCNFEPWASEVDDT